MNTHFMRLWGLCVIGLILITQCFVFIPEVEAAGNILFVKSDGTGTDCSQANPCLPTQALNDATAGDTIYFKHGIYIFIATGRYLTIDKAVSMIGGWDGSNTGDVVVNPSMYVVIVDGGNSGEFLEINDSSGSLITIAGFTFQNGNVDLRGGAIDVINGRVDIQGNIFISNYADSYGGAVYTNSSYEVQIIENIFDGNEAQYGGGSVYTGSSSNSVLIEGNQFYGGDAQYGTAIHSDRCSLTINRNLFSSMPGEAVIDLYSTGPASTVSNNFILQSGQKAVDLSGTNSSPHQVLNNTIVGGTVGIAPSNSSANIVNNIISGVNTGISSYTGTVTGSNNLFYNNSTDPVTLTDPVIDEDPLFVSPGTDDYHIQEDSPAINAGTTVSLDEDYDGESRPMGGGYDIGADEVSSGYLAYLPLVLK